MVRRERQLCRLDALGKREVGSSECLMQRQRFGTPRSAGRGLLLTMLLALSLEMQRIGECCLVLLDKVGQVLHIAAVRPRNRRRARVGGRDEICLPL